MTRPKNPCDWCGKVTESLKRTCTACRHAARRGALEPSQNVVALSGGEWVRRGLVMVWEPAPPLSGGWASCGTDGGYYRHRRVEKNQPCEACRTAHAAAKRVRLGRHRERSAA